MSKNKKIFTNQPSRARKLLAAGTAVVAGGASVYGLAHIGGADTPEQGRNNAVCAVTIHSGDTVDGTLSNLGVSEENKLGVFDPITGKTLDAVDQREHLLPGSEVMAAASPEACQAIGGRVVPIMVENPSAVREAIQGMEPKDRS